MLLPAAFVIVGMAGSLLAAAAKTLFSTMVIVSEMTGNYNLILPALFVCTLACLFSDRQSLYKNQVMSRSMSPAHQGTYVREVLAGLQVRLFLDPQWNGPVLHPEDPVAGVIDRFEDADLDVFPVTDGENRYLGVVSLEEIFLATQSTHAQALLLTADLMRTDVTPLGPDDGLDRAMELFAESDLLALPVVDGVQGKRVVGVVKRHDVAGDYLRRLHEPKSRHLVAIRKMNPRAASASLLLLASLASPAFALGPQDVYILVNKNVADSQAVADYYCAKRGVPVDHVIALDLPSGEDISRADYDAKLVGPLRKTIKDKRDKVKVLLAVYGVPLRVGGQAPNADERAELDKLTQEMATLEKKRKALDDDLKNLEAKAKDDPKGQPADDLKEKRRERADLESLLRPMERRRRFLSYDESHAAVDSELVLCCGMRATICAAGSSTCSTFRFPKMRARASRRC